VTNTWILLQLIWKHRKLRQRDHWTRGQLEAYQTGALRLLREHAHSPFISGFTKDPSIVRCKRRRF